MSCQQCVYADQLICKSLAAAVAAVYPDLNSWSLDVSLDYINSCTGLELDAQQVSKLLSRMALPAQPSTDGTSVHVKVPPTRSDVLHACDVMEVGLHLHRCLRRCLKC